MGCQRGDPTAGPPLPARRCRSPPANYIWANRLPKGEALANAFTDRAMMIAVESGPQLVGRWLTAERDIYADYTRLFGEEPPRIAGVAIMTDTDNTGERAVAYYDELRLRMVR